MTHFNRKYHAFTVGSSVGATPDIEVSTDGTFTMPGGATIGGTASLGTLAVSTAATFDGITSVSTLDVNGNLTLAGNLVVTLVTASVSNPIDITTSRMLKISDGSENWYIHVITSASVLIA